MRAVIPAITALPSSRVYHRQRQPEADSLRKLAVSPLPRVMFASLAMLFTSITPNIDSFNYPMFLLITPMFLFSGTFFPLSILPQAGQALAQALPLTHVVTIARGIAYGSMNAELLISVGYIALVTLLFFVLSIRLMKKRLIK